MEEMVCGGEAGQGECLFAWLPPPSSQQLVEACHAPNRPPSSSLAVKFPQVSLFE